ncbi:MAG: hypothetical protein ABT10_02885 [Novosphingobium sp. SCN 63-17]|nr:MAG: hypothetical protein ABT10_02885 [Novosphingobium sp. SCN 63-17]OJX92885.1 MAG: hypothetical protein BGP00_23485 [Novosphingobium sp. 63-713]
MIRRDRLRMLMSTHRVTQRALAAELGISAQTIGKILIGAPVDMRKLPIIARMFRVSQEYLLGETDDPSISAMEAAIDKEEWAILDLYRQLAPSGRLAVAEIMRTMAQAGKTGMSRLQERAAEPFTGPGIRHGLTTRYGAQG